MSTQEHKHTPGPWPELEAQLSRDAINEFETDAFEFERENRELV